MNRTELLEKLKVINTRMQSNNSFNSEQEAAEYLITVVPLLKLLDNDHYYHQFMADYQFLNRGLTSSSTFPTFARIKNTISLVIHELEINSISIVEMPNNSSIIKSLALWLKSFVLWLGKPIITVIVGVIIILIAAILTKKFDL